MIKLYRCPDHDVIRFTPGTCIQCGEMMVPREYLPAEEQKNMLTANNLYMQVLSEIATGRMGMGEMVAKARRVLKVTVNPQGAAQYNNSTPSTIV